MPIPALALAAIAQALPVLAQGGAAIGQNIRGNKLGKKKMPLYQTPQAIKELVSTQRNEFNDPDIYARNLADSSIDRGVGQGIYSATQAGGGSNEVLATISGLNRNANDAKNQLAMAGDRKSRDMAPSLSLAARSQDQGYEINKLNPYLQTQQAAADNLGASRMNYGNAVNNASKLIGQVANAKDPLRSPQGTGGTLSAEQMAKLMEMIKNL